MKKRLFPIIISLAVLIALGCSVFSLRIDNGLKEKLSVSVPKGVIVNHHLDFMSIDSSEYWTIKLSASRAKELKDELKSGQWQKLDKTHLDKIGALNFGIDYKSVIEKHSNVQMNCYISIFNAKTGENITDSENAVYEDCANWIICVFDAQKNYYYLFHESY